MTNSRKAAEANAAPRPRRAAFDREKGVEIAQHLFHDRGFDAVSVADLTSALDINPPSLYAAYGSKLALFERTLIRYAETEALPLEMILSSENAPAQVLTDLFRAAARHYTRKKAGRGCMVTEAMGADDKNARAIAKGLASPPIDLIRRFVARHAPKENVNRIVDYVVLTLRGISAYARMGASTAKLVDCAGIAGRALDIEFAPVVTRDNAATSTDTRMKTRT